MAKPKLDAGGGLAAVAYVLRKGREAGSVVDLYRRLRTNNACSPFARAVRPTYSNARTPTPDAAAIVANAWLA